MMHNDFTPLSTGTMEQILNGTEVKPPLVFQVLGSRRVAAATGGDTKNRYRLLVSDGLYIQPFAMLATELNVLYESNQLEDNTIIRINRYHMSMVNRNEGNERRVIVVFELDVLHPGSQVGCKIGNPEIKDMKAASSANPAGGPQKENMNGNAGSSNYNQYQKRETSANVSMNTSSANLNEHLCMPIESLSPYQNKWVIKARVTAKSNIRTWSNQRGDGKLFSFDLCDEGGEIRVTAFQQAVDKFYDLLEVDKVFYISKCKIKPANKQYTKLRNEYEMEVTNETVIQECLDDTEIPAIKYNFVPISDIASMEAGTFVDIIAVCKSSGDLVNLVSKAGRELVKREIVLVDQSETAINLTLWGEEAKNFDGSDQPVLLVKGAKIGEYGGGKTLGGGTNMKLNPDVPEGHRLRGWFDNGGLTGEVKELSTKGLGNLTTPWVNFHEAKINNLGAGDKPDYYQVKGFIHNIRSTNAFYKACSTPECNKKVIDQMNGTYRCEKCQIETPNFKYRLLVNMLVGDWTSNRWVTAFSDVAEVLLGKTANEIGELLENDKEAADALFSEIAFQQKTFKLRSKVETYQDVPKNKITVVSVTDTNYKEYNKHLLANIQRLTGIHPSSSSN